VNLQIPEVGRRPGFDPERYAWFLAPAGTACLVGAVAVGGWPGLSLVAAAVALLGVACWSREDGFLLLGPFPRVELTRQSRRQRIHLWRAVVLVLVSAPVLALAALAYGPVPVEYRVPRDLVRTIAEAGTLVVVFYLFLFGMALTSSVISTAVTDDREAKRLDFLLATSLRNREVVIGKSTSRAAGAIGYLLPVVPLVVLLPALFGAEPGLIAYAVGYAAVTTFSIAGVAAYGSVAAKTKRQSGYQQTRLVAPYVFFGWAAGMLVNLPAVWFYPGSPTNPAPASVGDAVDLFNTGNPIVLATRLMPAAVGGLSLAPAVAAFPGYAAFHVGVGLTCFLLAVAKLRAKAAEFAGEPPPEEKTAYRRPPVYEWPVVWKEMYAVPPQYLTRKGRRQAWLTFIVMVLLPAGVFLAAAVSDLSGYAESVVAASRFWPPLIVSVGVLAAIVVAAVTIARERERDTLTSLQLTDLSPEELLRQKFLGVLGANRGILYWQIVAGIPAVLAGAFPWWAFLGLLVTQVVYTVTAVALGLSASANATTVEKATRSAMLMVFCQVMVSTLLGAAVLATSPSGPPSTPPFQAYLLAGLYPPATIGLIPYARLAPPGTIPYWIAGIVVGWVIYLTMAWLFWRLARRRYLAACRVVQDGGPIDSREPGAKS